MGTVQRDAGTVVILKDGRTRQFRSKLERRRIVEETLKPGASVSLVARAHDVNTNQVFKWRRQYHQGRLEVEQRSSTLLPVKISDVIPTSRPENQDRNDQESSISIWAMPVYASKAQPIPTACERHWKGSTDDRPANRHTDMDRCGYDGLKTRFHWIECNGANRSRTESLFWTRVRLPWAAWGSDQAALVGR